MAAYSSNSSLFLKTMTYDRALIFGAPQVLHVGVGNCSNNRLYEILIQMDDIESALSAGSRLISLTLEKIEVFAYTTRHVCAIAQLSWQRRLSNAKTG